MINTPTIIKRIYPLKIQKEDPSKLSFIKLQKSTGPHLSCIDMRPHMPPVVDQGELGSCTANAFCGIIGYLQPKKPITSRLFLYYCTRFIANEVEYDSGATLIDGIKALKKFGVCREASWVYNIKKFTLQPPKQCYFEASLNKAIIVQNIKDTLSNLKRALAQGYPFVFGMLIYSSFESEDVAKTGMVPLPQNNDEILGGHALLAVGYCDEKQCFIVRNSWGLLWGDKGYCYIPYSYLLNPNLTSDFWIIKKMSA